MGEPPSSALPPMKSNGDRLDSWKEIAAYFHRDIKTVQRWEKREGMPVHRHQHDRLGTVYASSSELDTWSQGRRLRLEEEEEDLGAESAADAATPQFPLNESLTGKRVSHYRVLELLGGGGMGVVYKAEDLKLGRRVALKFLPGELANDPVALERLQREARAASALDHPNICSIYELGEHERVPYIVMQLLEGCTLREWIESTTPEDPALRLRGLLDFGSQIADGLHAAHQKGIIHRDIKPANIVVTSNGQAKILDFGVAKFLPEVAPESAEQSAASAESVNITSTGTGASVGTPSYLSPEQVRGEVLDPRTDLFSLGLVLYEMATGERAFAGNTITGIRNAVLTQPAMPARQINPKVPAAVEKVINKALEKNREQRYQSAEELRLDLESLRRDRDGRTNAMLRSVAIAMLLLLIAAGTFVILNFRPTHRLPFEVVKATRLTSAGQTAKAAISPDGRYIVHTELESGEEALRVRRADMLNDVELVPPRPVRYIGVGFSPNSETIYSVVRNAEDASGILYRMPVIGGSPQKVTENVASPIAVSPDGKRFAFVRETATESILLAADFDSQREQKLTVRKLPLVLDYPSWSPDGQRIAYTVTDSTIASFTGSDTRIMEIRVADGTERAFAKQTWAFIKQLAWLNDGSGLALSARDNDESGFFHIWHVSYPEGVGRKMTGGLHNQVGVSVSADSRKLVTVEENSSFGIWRLSSSSQPTLVVSVCGWSAPAWTPDHRIVFEEELDGRRTIWIVDANGANRRQVSLAGSNFDYTVSGNGRKLVWVSDRNGSPTLWAMDLDDGHPILVTTATGESFPNLSPDGKWTAFTAIGQEHWPTLWRVATSGGQRRELNDKLWMRPVISSDGKWIAGFYSDRQLGTQKFPDSIGIVLADGGPIKKAIPIPASVSLSAGLRWTADGRELTYVNRGKGGDNIWSQPVDGGAPHQVTEFSGIRLFSFDWSADGKELAFSRGMEAHDVVLVEDARR